MYFTFRKEDDMIVASKVNIKKMNCLTESFQENITKSMFHISIISMLSVFLGRHIVCLHRHFVC